MQGLATLKAFGQSGERGRRLEERARELFKSTMWVLGTNTLARGITDTGIAVGAAAALALGAWRVGTGAMSLPALLVILMLGVEVFRPLRELRVLLHQGMLGLAAARGIFALLDAAPLVRRPRPGARAGRRRRGLRGRHVHLSRAPRASAHVGLSFAVPPGERVGFVGASGSGKSTVARLLLRFHDPDRGRVTIGGRDLRELSLEQIRGRIAVVSQDTWLFHGTVEDNIRMGRPDATDRGAAGGRPRGQRRGVHRSACRRATPRWSASAACGCRAASASASPSRARCCATRRSWCSTRRSRRWTPRARR